MSAENQEPVLDVRKFLEEFQDQLAPRLDVYEQAIYIYIFRHSRLIGKADAVIAFKSERRKIAFGIGEKGKPMSESTCYGRLSSLQQKGCIQIVETQQHGKRVKLLLPSEIHGVVTSPAVASLPSIEEMDFFAVKENRLALLKREGNLCFYCLQKLTSSPSNYVIDHVKSRPLGDNSYRNLVAACRNCNNRKKEKHGSAEDFLRVLRREGRLGEEEFDTRIKLLERLLRGERFPHL